jgi:ABC-type transport system involved in multi-copper enzyme maturation permease subunit
MLRSEFLKLRKDRTLLVIFIFIVFYIVSGPLLTAPNVKEFFKTAGTGELLSGFTTDTAFQMMLIGLVSAAAFAAEFSLGTIRNVLINNTRSRVYFSKTIAVAVTVFVFLFAWYLSGFVFTVLSRQMLPSFTDIKFYGYRFIVQYLLVLMQTGFITVVGIITGKRAIANISTIFIWMASAFLPIKGQFAAMFIESQYEWGNAPSVKLMVVLAGVIIVSYAIGFLLFSKKEIRN